MKPFYMTKINPKKMSPQYYILSSIPYIAGHSHLIIVIFVARLISQDTKHIDNF